MFDDILNSHYSRADELAGRALLPHVLPHLEAPQCIYCINHNSLVPQVIPLAQRMPWLPLYASSEEG